jgi:tetratricopeptide (TPR) repeat protein
MQSLLIFKRVFAVSLFLVLVSSVALGQGSNLPRRSGLPGVGTIKGRVTTPSGGSVRSNVKVTIRNFSTSGVVNFTDSNGEFTFSGLGSGTYYIDVVADPASYEMVTETIHLPPNGRIMLVIPLKEKSSGSKKPAAGVVSIDELSQDVPEGAKKEMARATKLIEKGVSKEAIKHLNKAIEIYPSYFIARNTLGVEYLKVKQLDAATEQFQQAIGINPKAFGPRLYLGVALVQQKNYRSALEHLNQAVSINGSQASAQLYLGIALLGSDDLPAAEIALNKAISIGGAQFALARYYSAHVHLKKGDLNQAVEELKTYLKEAPEGEQASHARALLDKLAVSK